MTAPAPIDRVHLARAALAAAGRASNLRVRTIHLALASGEISSLETDLNELRILYAAQTAEAVRLHDAHDAEAKT